MPGRVVAVFVLLALLGVPSLFVGQRLCAEPLDISGTTQLPPTVTDVKRRDEIAYPAHVILGSLLALLGCRPSAVALQWFKAAGHARSDAELERTVRGIAAARRRSRSDQDLESVLCPRTPSSSISWQQIDAVERAGLHCDTSSWSGP